MTETHGGEIRHFDHPGAGRRRAKATPKGRGVDLLALDEVRALLGDRPRRRDLLIEHLHLIQDRYGQLSAAHLAALAEEHAFDGVRFDKLAIRQARREEAPAQLMFELGETGLDFPAPETRK